MIDTEFYSLPVFDIVKETANTVSIVFNVDESLKAKFDFTPGQYLTLKAMIDGEDVRRSYSISSGKGDDGLRIAVKQIENGIFSTFANQQIRVGQELQVMPPTGNFILKNQDEGKTSVFIAAGSGITPVLSMLKETLRNTSDNAVLIYGNRDADSIIYRAEVEKLTMTYGKRFKLHYVISRDNTFTGLKGRINEAIIEKIATEISMDAISGIYLCGPEEMVNKAKAKFQALGVDKSRIHFELFFVAETEDTKTAVANLGSTMSKVTMIIDDEEFEFELASNGATLLEAGSEAGADLPFGCKGGVCCTCKAKVLEGKAEMIQNFSLEADEVEQGFILTCQAHPVSEKIVVSFDEY